MTWLIRRPHCLRNEMHELATNSNYRESCTRVNRTLVSSGEILVRLKGRCQGYPVLIVFPDAMPYTAPQVFMLNRLATEEEVEDFAKLSPSIVWLRLAELRLVKFYYHRHQNWDGSLCILDRDDLHDDSPEFIGVRATIGRVREWLVGTETGRFPPDSQEVDLWAHFPNRADYRVLLPDEFFDERLCRGRFYLYHIQWHPNDTVYYGWGLDGVTRDGVTLARFVTPKSLFLSRSLPDGMLSLLEKGATEDLERRGIIKAGYWWDTPEQPKPFSRPEELSSYIDDEVGLENLAKALTSPLSRKEDAVVALRFRNRRGALEWQFFVLPRPEDDSAALIGRVSLEELTDRLRRRPVRAVPVEYLTDAYFHMRNGARTDRAKLERSAVTMIGVGALGSSVTECLAKGGVGRIHLVDKGSLSAHNVVRHAGGFQDIGRSKVSAVAWRSIAMHNPFIPLDNSDLKQLNILDSKIHEYFPEGSIGVSTIADDTVEGFLNEESVLTGRTVFYARVLRGGKAARIFRVKPGVDACKHCLSIYKADGDSRFPDIPEDPTQPMLTNECNNPVRPASAADIEQVAGVTARVVMDYLQNPHTEINHWVWHTESLPGLDLAPDLAGVCRTFTLPPHPKCEFCQQTSPKDVLITQGTLEKIVRLARESGEIETGGVLIGFRSDGGNLVVVEATEPGPKAVRTKDRFERDNEYCQEQLEKATEQYGLKGQYIGEWHYHPIGGNSPSGLDVASLSQIARQVEYPTEEPVLVIISSTGQAAFTLHPAFKGFVETAFQVVDAEVIDMVNPRIR